MTDRTLSQALSLKLTQTTLAIGVLLAAGAAHAQSTFKIAYIDPLSGPFTNVGELMLSRIQFAVDNINAKGGVLVKGKEGTKLQLLKFDSKLSAQESLGALQAAVDQGARAIVTGGVGLIRSGRLGRCRQQAQRAQSRQSLAGAKPFIN